MKGNVLKTKRDAVPFKDMSHSNAERRPGKLDEREHGVYMTEAEENFNIEEIQKPTGDPNRPSHVVLFCARIET